MKREGCERQPALRVGSRTDDPAGHRAALLDPRGGAVEIVELGGWVRGGPLPDQVLAVAVDDAHAFEPAQQRLGRGRPPQSRGKRLQCRCRDPDRLGMHGVQRGLEGVGAILQGRGRPVQQVTGHERGNGGQQPERCKEGDDARGRSAFYLLDSRISRTTQRCSSGSRDRWRRTSARPRPSTRVSRAEASASPPDCSIV